MASWVVPTNPIDPANINNGNEFQAGDGIKAQDINKTVEAALYAQEKAGEAAANKLDKKSFSNNPATWVNPSTFIADDPEGANKHRILAGLYCVDEDGNQIIIPFSMAGGARQDGYPEGTSTDPNGPPLGVPTPVMYNTANQILCCKATDAKHAVPKGQVDALLANKLDKVAATSANARKLYGTNNSGGSYMWNVLRTVAEMQTTAGGILGRADNGAFVVPTPTASQHIANKGYVDSLANTFSETISTSGSFTQALFPNIYYLFTGELTAVSISFEGAVSGRENEYKGQFTVGSIIPIISFPSTISWVGGSFPTLETNKTYQFSVLNNIGVVVGV